MPKLAAGCSLKRDARCSLVQESPQGLSPAQDCPEVREAFLHCAKALMRSRLWDPDAQVDRSVLPTMGEMLKDQVGSSDPPETEEAMRARYRTGLY